MLGALWSREMLTFRMLTSLAVTFTAQHSNASQNISTVPKSKCAACQVSGPGSGLGPGPGLGLGLGLAVGAEVGYWGGLWSSLCS
jgi:hypothetical protein